MATALSSIIIVLIASVIGAFGALYLKKGSAKFSLNILELIKNYKLILGFFFYGVASIMFIYALQFAEVSVLYPFVATSYIWTCLLSVKFLGEKMNKWKWAGIAAILIGVSLIGIGS